MFPNKSFHVLIAAIMFFLCCMQLTSAHVFELLTSGQSVGFQVLAPPSKAFLIDTSNHVEGQTKQSFSRKMGEKNDDEMMLQGFSLESMIEKKKRCVNGQNNVCVVRHMKDQP